MTAVLRMFGLLLLSEFGQSQYITELRSLVPGRTTVRAKELSPTLDSYPPDDVEAVAARKRNYQAAFAILASQMAARSRIFTDASMGTSNLPSGKNLLALRTNQNLQHRNFFHIVKTNPNFPRSPRLFNPVYPSQTVAFYSSMKSDPNVYPQPATHQLAGTYIYNNVESLESLGDSERKEEEPLVILTNGFLADTPEVQAAKRKHFATVARTRAALARTRSRKVSHDVQDSAAQRRVSTNFYPIYKPQIYYDY